ncbi:MAG: class I SAM-dependent methyltransferase [Actinomycetota bacterium]
MDAAGWDDRYHATDRLWSAEPNVFVADRLSDLEPGVGLDLASGEGRNAVWLAERGWEMTAVDFSAVAVERGREHSDDVEFVVADVLTWEPDRQFDLILIVYLHLEESEFEPLVRRVVTWLAPGGELFMVGHDRTNLEYGVGGPPRLEVLWDVDQIVSWLEDLDIVEARVLERDVEGEERTARDALIRARAVPGRTRSS